MRRKTLAPFRLAVVAVEKAMERAEIATRGGQTPPPPELGLREALLDAERARVAVTAEWCTLADAHELTVLDAELTRAYRRSVELAPPPRARALRSQTG